MHIYIPTSINYGSVWGGYKFPDHHFKAFAWIARFCFLYLYRNFPNFSILCNKGLLRRSLTDNSGHASFAIFEHVAFEKSSFFRFHMQHQFYIVLCFEKDVKVTYLYIFLLTWEHFTPKCTVLQYSHYYNSYPHIGLFKRSHLLDHLYFPPEVCGVWWPFTSNETYKF